jgi:hypothetical protein
MDSLQAVAMMETFFGNIPSYYGLLWNMGDLCVAKSGVSGFKNGACLVSNLENLELGYNNFRGTLLTKLAKLANPQ